MNIGVIGAGATGLSAAYHLSCKGHNVTVFEAENHCGGIASSVNMGKGRLERFYHHIFTNDSEIINLINELGLSDKLKWYPPKNAIYISSRLFPFTSALDLARFSEIPFIQRIKLGMLVLRSCHLKDWKELEEISAEEWLRKSAGKDAYEKLWGPLLESKFDEDAGSISAAWLWNKFKLRGGSRKGNVGREMLGYMDGSFEVLYKELERRIALNGGHILTDTRVVSIALKDDGLIQVISSKCKTTFDKVIVTTAPQVFMEIAGNHLPSNYINSLAKISYKANICMVLELSEPLSPYYWITVSDRDFPFVLLIEHTRLVPSGMYDSHIVYLSRYLDGKDPLYDTDDKAISKSFVDYVKKMFPSFNPDTIINTHIYRTRYAQPVVVRKYSGLVPLHKTPVDNLYLACMAQIYPEDRGQNHALRMGREIARLMDE